MGDAALRVEEHQIAGLALRRGNRRTLCILVAGAVIQAVAKRSKDRHGKAGTVRTGIAGTAVDIGRAQIGVGVGDQVLTHGAGSGSAFVIGIVHRLGIVGADIAGGLAIGDLVPTVNSVLQMGHLTAVDGTQHRTAGGFTHVQILRHHHAVILLQQGGADGCLYRGIGLLPGRGFLRRKLFLLHHDRPGRQLCQRQAVGSGQCRHIQRRIVIQCGSGNTGHAGVLHGPGCHRIIVALLFCIVIGIGNCRTGNQHRKRQTEARDFS